MDFFKDTKVKDHDYPIRKITLTPTSSRERPFVIYVGQTFDVNGQRDALEISRIEYRMDIYDKSQDRVYDVYAIKKEDGYESRWKRFENISSIDIGYDMDF